MNQTFTNFEVIVVDDCSTDNSFTIAENYVEKFGGRMALFKLEENMGNPAIPRNKGFELSQGEYVYFVDSDDKITETALEKMYTLAKENEADVVYQTRNYSLSEGGLTKKISATPKFKKTGDKITTDDNLVKRIDGIVNAYYLHVWRSFCKRNLIAENNLFFPNVKQREDVLWHFGVLIYAKRVLLTPEPLYFYRINKNSILRSKKTPAQTVIFDINPLILGLKTLDESIRQHEFLKANPQYHYILLAGLAKRMFRLIYKESTKLSQFEIYDAIKSAFGERLGEYDILIPVLCSYVNGLQKYYNKKLQKLTDSAEQAQKRIAELENELQKLKS